MVSSKVKKKINQYSINSFRDERKLNLATRGASRKEFWEALI